MLACSIEGVWTKPLNLFGKFLYFVYSQASSEKKQKLEIFQKKCCGKPDFRVYVPEHGSVSWWCPDNFAVAKGTEPPAKWPVAAIVEVRIILIFTMCKRFFTPDQFS